MKNFFFVPILLFFAVSLVAQQVPFKTISERKASQVDIASTKLNIQLRQTSKLPIAKNDFFHPLKDLHHITIANDELAPSPIVKIASDKAGKPTWVKGLIDADYRSIQLEDQAYLYLDMLKQSMLIEAPQDEFIITNIEHDDLGYSHIKMKQTYQGVPVYGSEVILHAEDNRIKSFNGRYHQTPAVSVAPSLAGAEAIAITKEALAHSTHFGYPNSVLSAQILPENKEVADLVIYYDQEDLTNAQLAWKVTIHPNMTERWEYIIDAHTGSILNHFLNSCKFAGDHMHFPKGNKKDGQIHKEESHSCQAHSSESFSYDPEDAATASGQDLNGVTRTFGVWSQSGTYYMVDASKTMFNAGQSNMPNEPVGSLFTIDGNNTYPGNSNFNTTHLTSGSAFWNDGNAVSAHFNADVSYEYFKNVHGRNSINGSGGNVVSLVNIADEDGQPMDNAFWNGNAMFYGNGNTAFSNLAGALDVGGHEMSHGVIGNTANLTYQGESGAINESFADIFGAMIDRDDWQLGEDVVNTQYFPSGALRDMANPHNGGSSLNDNGYQPAHTNEQYHGSQDNGGVHINSGIPNKAYYLYATQVGKDKAEKVYYKALTQYLTASSQFKDLRIAVLNSAIDLYGDNSNEASQVGAAFDAVGISGPSSGGGTVPPTNYENDLPQNPGSAYVLYVKDNGYIGLAESNGTIVEEFESTKKPLSLPSITDDGTLIVYAAEDNTIRQIELDWQGGLYTDSEVSDETFWRNLVISPDGTKLAATTTDNDNQIWVFKDEWKSFTLYNPTYTQGVSTGDVRYPDIIKFDYSGDYIMYDALSELTGQGTTIEYWDFGFLHVWDNNNWADGNIQKLYTTLPENVDIGNPTFSKNSPYIIAFDYRESTTSGYDYFLNGANLESGNSATIATNDVLSYPSYSIDDKLLIADAGDNFGGTDLYTVPLADSKIEYGTGDPQQLIVSAGWGNYFANGTRSLVINTEDLLDDHQIKSFPNPFSNEISFEWSMDHSISRVDVMNAQGQFLQTITPEGNKATISTSELPAGMYLFRLVGQEGNLTIVKGMRQ